MRKNFFISYRRIEGAQVANLISSRLRKLLPVENVFLDIISIPSGLDFFSRIKFSIEKSDIVIAIIGNNWLREGNAKFGENNDSPFDYVRMELEVALDRGKTIVPLLIDGASMPLAHQLPESLRSLVALEAIVVDVKNIDLCFYRIIKDHSVSFIKTDKLINTLRLYQSIVEWYPNFEKRIPVIKKYCTLLTGEEICGLIDLTIGSSGKHFLILTNIGIHHRSNGTVGDSSFHAYGKINAIKVDERRSLLIVNNELLAISGTLEEEVSKLMMEMVKEYKLY